MEKLSKNKLNAIIELAGIFHGSKDPALIKKVVTHNAISLDDILYCQQIREPSRSNIAKFVEGILDGYDYASEFMPPETVSIEYLEGYLSGITILLEAFKRCQ